MTTPVALMHRPQRAARSRAERVGARRLRWRPRGPRATGRRLAVARPSPRLVGGGAQRVARGVGAVARFECADAGALSQRSIDGISRGDAMGADRTAPSGLPHPGGSDPFAPIRTLLRSALHVRPYHASARTFLAVRREAGRADRRGAGRARSRSARDPVRPARPAVLDHAGLPAVRRAPTTRAPWRWPRRRPSTARSARAPSGAIARGSFPATRCGCATCSRSSAPLPSCEVLIDDRPIPYARELWLPLVWFLLLP